MPFYAILALGAVWIFFLAGAISSTLYIAGAALGAW